MPDEDRPDWSAHEEVVVHHDRATGLRAIVAIHSTALGPALGGTRCRAYPDDDAALADVLDLARAMSYKNALAGLAHGGGKAVVLTDGSGDRPELLRAYGRFVESLGGRYVTAGDVGTTVADLDVIGETTRWVTGRSPERGGSGDSGRLTALGVLHAMRAGAEAVWGEPTLVGRRVGVLGLGKVGSRLVGHLVAEGARVLAYDPNQLAAETAPADADVELAASAEQVLAADLEVLSPNALGRVLTDEVARSLRCQLVCGGANNQLAAPAVADVLHRRGVLYLPDFLVNAGGVVQVADELVGYDDERATAGAAAIGDTCRDVLAGAQSEAVTPTLAAERLAEARMAAGAWSEQLFPGLADATARAHWVG